MALFRNGETRARTITMRDPKVDITGAIEDVRRHLDTPPDNFGLVADLTRRLGRFPGETFLDIATLITYQWSGSVWFVLGSGLQQQAVSGRRNLLSNGAMQVCQRVAYSTGVSVAATAFPYPAADRWQTVVDVAGATVTAYDFTTNAAGFAFDQQTILQGTQKVVLAPNDNFIWRQRIEGLNLQRVMKGRTRALPLTLSFVVSTFVPGTYIVELQDDANGRSVSASYTTIGGSVPEYKTLTFPADTTGTWPNTNAAALSVQFWFVAGSTFNNGSLASLNTVWGVPATNTRMAGCSNLFANATTGQNQVNLTGVQLEVGSYATPFEHRTYADELTECERYYFRRTSTNATQILATGYTYSTTNGYVGIPLPVPMRAHPTFGVSAVGSYNVEDAGGVVRTCTGLTQATTTTADHTVFPLVFSTAAVMTGGWGTVLRGNANAWIDFSAEL